MDSLTFPFFPLGDCHLVNVAEPCSFYLSELGRKKFFHPWNVHVGGMFLEVKNPKNLNRKVVLDPNTIFKNHHFDIIFHTFGASGHFPLSAVFKVRNITTNWWLLKIVIGCKTTFGIRFFGIFTSKNMPPYGKSHGCNFFFDISKSLSNKPSLPR